MSLEAERGCAQDADGNLLSPSKIKWFNDVDDETPISGATVAPASCLSTSSKLKPATLMRYFASADLTAPGARRSGRATRPSTKVIDLDNAESHGFSATSGVKCKANPAGDMQQHRRVRTVTEGTDDEGSYGDDSQNEDDVEPTEKATTDEEDLDDPEASYASTKALGDADREVSFLSAQRVL
jgi:hypothetical protein